MFGYFSILTFVVFESLRIVSSSLQQNRYQELDPKREREREVLQNVLLLLPLLLAVLSIEKLHLLEMEALDCFPLPSF